MKQFKILFTLLLGLLMITSCSDDNEPTNKNNVPQSVEQAFKAKYKNVTDVQWEVVKDYHVARFNSPITRDASKNYSSSAWFTNTGLYLQSDEDIPFGKLPSEVQNAFNSYKETYYADWEMDDCEMVAREGLGIIFVIEIEKGNVEREISISEFGDILKDILDDDDEDDILPIIIPEEIRSALKTLFPETFEHFVFLEIEFDEDEIEIDLLEGNKHKEITLNTKFEWVSTEYKASIHEASLLLQPEILKKLEVLAKKYGIDIYDEAFKKQIKIEVEEHLTKGLSFEIEFKIGDMEIEIKIDKDGNLTVDEEK